MDLYGYTIDAWTVWGLLAQGVFFASFVVQWYKSEKKKESYLPMEFWVIRMVGSIMLIIYVVYRKDIVFLIALVLQIVIYSRNIFLMKNEPKK